MTLKRFILAIIHSAICIAIIAHCTSCTSYQEYGNQNGHKALSYVTFMQDSTSEKVYNSDGRLIIDRTGVDNKPVTDSIDQIARLQVTKKLIDLGGEAVSETADALTTD